MDGWMDRILLEGRNSKIGYERTKRESKKGIAFAVSACVLC